MKSSEKGRPGRPREFDTEEVLDRAMRLFWRKGYASTSISDLTESTGVNRPSLYAAFGNKQSMFLRVLERYTRSTFSYFRTALGAPTARAVAERLMQGGVNLATDPRNPAGCLWVRGSLSYGDGSPLLRREMLARRRAGEEALAMRFERAREEGDLPPQVDPVALARFLQAVHFGMQVQAASGVGRSQLEEVVDVALRALPDASDTTHSIPTS